MSSNPKCLKCGKTVYATDKICPKSDLCWHKNCFKCYTCGLQLTLNNYMLSEKAVYCKQHFPKPSHTQAQPDIQKISPGSSLQPPSPSRPHK